MLRISLLALVAACSLSACDNDPRPSTKTADNIANTRMAVTKVKQSLTVEGCSISVHRVHTSISDSLNSFTLAVADCPTATVTTTNQNCGKNCMQNAMLVEPKGVPEGVTMSARKEAAEAKLNELRRDAATLAEEVRRIEAELGNK